MAKFRVVVTHDSSSKHFEVIWDAPTPQSAFDLTFDYLRKIGKDPAGFTFEGWGYIPDSYQELNSAAFETLQPELSKL